MRHVTLIAGLTLGAAFATATPCSGQNALGGGSALDGNLLEGAGRYNSRAPLPNFRGRNLLVTGNVAAGRGFRGTVGYAAEFDFRAGTGSDDLFAERADSALSAPTFLNAGRTMELMRYGQHLNEVEYRRATRGATLENLDDMRFVASDLDDRIKLDRVAISSTTSAIYENAADSRIVGMLLDPEGKRYSATASSLTGIQLTPVESQGSIIGLSTYDMARAVGDTLSGRAGATIGRDFDGGFRNLLGAEIREAVQAEPLTTLVEPQVREGRIGHEPEPSYLEILQRVAERRAGPEVDLQSSPELLTDLDRRFEDLRDALTASPGADDAEPADGEPTTETRAGTGLPGSPTAIAEMAEALRHGEDLEHYGTEAPTRFNELMRSGERRLAEGQYFWAERHFERALRFTPGHPLAVAGMGHAQIGAGLHVPAALTLRRLMTSNPEMIDVRYRPELLPSRLRLDVAIEQLRDRIARVERDREMRGFVLAYIGHQLDDRAMIEEGLRHMGEDPLRLLLEAVWLPAEN